MPLGIDENEHAVEEGSGGGFELEGGNYKFKIDECKETTFKTGSKGMKAKLLVDVGSKYDQQVYLNIVYSHFAWMVKRMAHSVGMEYDPEKLSDYMFEGRIGHADFKTEEVYSEKHGKTFTNLKLEEFTPHAKFAELYSDSGDSAGDSSGPPPMDDDVPF